MEAQSEARTRHTPKGITQMPPHTKGAVVRLVWCVWQKIIPRYMAPCPWQSEEGAAPGLPGAVPEWGPHILICMVHFNLRSFCLCALHSTLTELTYVPLESYYLISN